MQIDTRGAGGGSYPEPPADYFQTRMCARCPETAGLLNVNGTALCVHCAADAVFERADHDEIMAYINDSFREQFDFYVKHFLENENELVRLDAAKHAFAAQDQSWRETVARDYVDGLRDDFLDHMRRRRNYERL